MNQKETQSLTALDGRLGSSIITNHIARSRHVDTQTIRSFCMYKGIYISPGYQTDDNMLTCSKLSTLPSNFFYKMQVKPKFQTADQPKAP